MNMNQVLRLTNELAVEDPNVVRFSVDAGLIDRLGRELVGKAETAVAELIKNAYDADATWVELLFENTNEPNGFLTITDDGLGMSRAELVNGFMRLSSTEKVAEPISPRLKRRRAGRKGIGRFAVQRLGGQMEIVTQTLNQPKALRVLIDWSMFKGGDDLNSVASRVEEINKERSEGTTIRITKLREAWSETALKRVYRIVSELIQPITLRDNRPTSKKKFEEDSPNIGSQGLTKKTEDFQIRLRRDDGKNLTVVDEMSEVLKHAVATIEGFVDETGYAYWSCESNKIALGDKIVPISSDREKPHIPYKILRNVDFKAYYLIQATDLIPRAVIKSIGSLAQDRGGIRLYRNGYRVLPYGEKRDDWLGLDASTRSRAYLPQHTNYNFFGYVEIDDLQGALFEETASREGLLENDALGELQDFVYRSLMAAVTRIAEVRGRKATASQKDWQKRESPPKERVDAGINALQKAIENSREQATIDPNISHKENMDLPEGQQIVPTLSPEFVEETLGNIKDALAEDEEDKKALLQENAMLRVLSSLGLVIGEFTHEVKQTLGATRSSTNRLRRRLDPESEVFAIAQGLSGNLTRFDQYVSYFDRAVRDNNRRELEVQDLRALIPEWLELVRPSAERRTITLLPPDLDGDLILTCPMHISEWASLLFNFYSNAEKAIRRARTQGVIGINCGVENGRVYMEFSDNGDGIPLGNVERVFNAFFTTSTPAAAYADEEDAMQGSGLGLKIARDIVSSYGGDISLVDASVGFSTCFRVEFPEASQEEKDKYVY